ncbi:HTH-type sugar sensing transcriptional regulator TrmB [Candidatus Gugararchaeum adminiculabundum]|nr:HTH-type sugar sensing transcriptional regulator TrmB [Candidatus Gugararchaeum adminiculabundum]
MAGELETLEEMGLSANEAKLYLMLIRGGEMKANELSVKSGLQRRTVYDTMQQLEKKGMVGKAEISGVTTFSASPPAALMSFLDEKKNSLEKILPELSKRFEAEEKTQVSVLYGVGGIKTVLEDILETKPDWYYSYHGQMQFYDLMPKFIQMFHDKCAKMGINTKYLLLDVPQARERSKLMRHAEVKFITPTTISAGVWWTYKNRLILFVLPKEGIPITMFIKNEELAKAFTSSFMEMFNSHKGPLYRGDAVPRKKA